MGTHSTSVFEIKSWDEKPYDEVDGLAKLTRARVVKTYTGDIEGEGTNESLMTYQEGGAAASYTGLERIICKIANKSGSFVIQEHGTYTQAEGAKTEFFIVPGSGTGELAGIRGKGSYIANQPPFRVELDYYFDE